MDHVLVTIALDHGLDDDAALDPQRVVEVQHVVEGRIRDIQRRIGIEREAQLRAVEMKMCVGRTRWCFQFRRFWIAIGRW